LCRGSQYILILDAESFFKSIFVIGVDDAGYAVTNKSAGLGIKLNFGGIGNLFYANDYFHVLYPPFI